MKTVTKIVCVVAIVVMSFLSLEVIIGLTSFYVGEVARIRLAAFIAVAALPCLVVVLYFMMNRRSERSWPSLFMTLGALICDLILVSFANGRI